MILLENGKIMKESRRTHTCGELNLSDKDTTVCLSGWVHKRRDHGGLIFIDLRDRYGLTQLVFDPAISSASHKLAESLRAEYVITVVGKVRYRGDGLINPKLSTGEIEIEITEVSLLSQSNVPPFPIAEDKEVNEDLRLRYRFLDIRKGKIGKNLQIRHKTMLTTRNYLSDNHFLEINTPILAKTTPEGARDYLVPSRIYPGSFYALPQSPQIFKQLLMIGGMDRYFQIAPCFRDEDLRADRQPEFFQIDLEMSFSDQKELFALIEELMSHIFQSVLGISIPTPFPIMSHATAMDKYGTDKPDLRFDLSFVDIDEIIKNSSFSLLHSVQSYGGICKAMVVPGGGKLSRREIDELISFVSPFGLKGLAWMKKQDGKLSSNICKFFTEEQLLQLDTELDVNDGDLILIGAEKKEILLKALDHLRRHIAKKMNLIPLNTYAFTWVTDFPLFAWDEEEQQLASESHPFTSPHPDDIYLLDEKPLEVRSLAYDLVLNGYELGSGSKRIHESELQKRVFSILRLKKEQIDQKFGFFLEALKYGTPPHLGIALGLDRLIMILSHTDNIREVIAFPKNQKAADLMMQAPSKADPALLRELEINHKKKR